jgi:sugar phosphate isomerase/epimerase
MKFAICNEIFQGWQLDATLNYASRLGYSAVELAPFTLANSVVEISSAQRQADLRVGRPGPKSKSRAFTGCW